MEKIVKVLYQPIDRGEDGRAYMPAEVVFTQQKDAEEVSKPWNWDKPSFRAVYVMDNRQEYEEWKRGEVRRKALAKLSQEERDALGLS